jgi:hypothetical protein
MRRSKNEISQRTQIVWHVAEFLYHLGIVEIARGRIASARKCHRTNMTFLAQQRFNTHRDGDMIEASSWFAGRNSCDKARLNLRLWLPSLVLVKLVLFQFATQISLDCNSK